MCNSDYELSTNTNKLFAKSSALHSKHVASMMIVVVLTVHQLIIQSSESVGLVGLCVGILNRKIDFQGIIGHPNSCCNPSCRSIYSINTITTP